MRRGMLGDFLDALETAAARLKEEPLRFGDKLHRAKHQDGVFCNGVSAPLLFRFVVYQSKKTVIVHRVLPLPGSALDDVVES